MLLSTEHTLEEHARFLSFPSRVQGRDFHRQTNPQRAGISMNRAPCTPPASTAPRYRFPLPPSFPALCLRSNGRLNIPERQVSRLRGTLASTGYVSIHAPSYLFICLVALLASPSHDLLFLFCHVSKKDARSIAHTRHPLHPFTPLHIPIHTVAALPVLPAIRTPSLSHSGLLLRPLKEIHIRKLLHLIHINRLDDLLVVEEDPGFLVVFGGDGFADEGDVVPTPRSVPYPSPQRIERREHTQHEYSPPYDTQYSRGGT